MGIDKFIYLVFVIFLSYFVILMLYYICLVLIGLVEERKKAREHLAEDYGTLSVSKFTMPVSVIIPAHNEERWIMSSLQSALNLEYPEFEVIIVNDGSTDKTQELLNNFLNLKSVDRNYFNRFRRHGQIQGIFDSQSYPNVTVVADSGGYKKAGALNIGLNFAKYKYICILDADTVLEPDTLLKVMAHVQKEPDNIIGIGSYFGLVNGFKIKDGKIIERSFSYNPLTAYQNLEYIRSFLGNRIAWSKFNSMPILAGGFSIWRRDIFLGLGGFNVDFSCEDLEFTFRAQDYILENKKNAKKILMLPYYAGWTEGPSNIRSLILQRNRWQRVTNETVWKYRHMLFNPKHKIFAFLTMPYFVFYEVLGIFFELASVILVMWGWIMKVLDLNTFFAFILLMILSQTLISLLSIFAFIRDQKVFNLRYIFYLAVLSFLEFFCYRWILTIAKLSGFYGYFKGVRTYDQYERVNP